MAEGGDVEHRTMALMALAAAAFTAPTRPVRSSPMQHIVMRKKESWARRLPAGMPIAPGSVLCAAEGSFDHYFMDSLVLVIEHSSDGGTKGVLLNHETPFTVADMTDGLGEIIGQNTLFLGGDAGPDTMLMLHGMPLLEGSRRLRPDVADDMLCIGGVKAAIDMAEAGQLRGA